MYHIFPYSDDLGQYSHIMKILMMI